MAPRAAGYERESVRQSRDDPAPGDGHASANPVRAGGSPWWAAHGCVASRIAWTRAGPVRGPLTEEMCRPCTSSSWDAGGWAPRSPSNWYRLDHSVPIIDQDPLAFRRLGDDFPGKPGHRRRLRPRDPDRGRHRAGRRLRRRQQRRQLQHHRRPRRPRDVRRAAGRRPHLRPEAGRGVRAARHPDRRDRALDGRAGCSRACSARRRPRRGATRPARSRMLHVSPHEGWVGRTVADFESVSGARVGAAHPVRRRAARRCRRA